MLTAEDALDKEFPLKLENTDRITKRNQKKRPKYQLSISEDVPTEEEIENQISEF